MDFETFYLCTQSKNGMVYLSDKREIIHGGIASKSILIGCSVPHDFKCSMLLFDFLAVVGGIRYFEVTDANSSHDVAVRALNANLAIVLKFRSAGPYETVFKKTMARDFCETIAKNTVSRMQSCVPIDAQEAFNLRVYNLPNLLVEIPVGVKYVPERSETACIGYMSRPPRGTYAHYVLPVYTKVEPGECAYASWEHVVAVFQNNVSVKQLRRYIADTIEDAPRDLLEQIFTIIDERE
jgi:hypothetical protein